MSFLIKKKLVHVLILSLSYIAILHLLLATFPSFLSSFLFLEGLLILYLFLKVHINELFVFNLCGWTVKLK